MTVKQLFRSTLLDNERGIVICGHINPDFDSLSSMMLIKEYIKGDVEDDEIYYDNIKLIVDEKDVLTDDLVFFKKHYNKENDDSLFEYRFEVENPSETTLIMVDICSDKNRLPKFVSENINLFENIIIIDHHEQDDDAINNIKNYSKNAKFFINPSEQSCAEYIYSMFPDYCKDMSKFQKLYTFGILGDSGNKKFSTPRFKLNKSIEDILDEEWFTLSDKEAIALAKLTYQISKQGYAHISLDESEKYPNVGKLACYLSVALDDMAFDLIKEDESGCFRHSLRAGENCNIDVSKIANTVGGGGHVKSSGAITKTAEPLIRL